MPKNSSAARREEVRRVAAAENIPYTAALRRVTESRAADHYFVAVVAQGFGRYGNGATVRDARTGETTALVTMPAGYSHVRSVTATAEPGVFYLTSDDHQSPHHFRMRVDGEGAVAEFEPAAHVADDRMAASPDGSRMAFRAEAPDGFLALGTLNLATGERRAVTSRATGWIGNLSWAADGRTVAFEYHTGTEWPGGLYVVDIEAARDLFADSREVASVSGDLGELTDPLISHDGRHLLVTAAQPEPTGGPHWNRLLEIPVAGGEPRVLFEMRFENSPYNRVYMWHTVCRDATGPRLLVFSAGYVYRIDVPSGEVVRLPFPEGTPHSAAW